jgi:Ras GTPase-activating-like protein IQGAP2/3
MDVLGPAPKQLPRKENRVTTLELFSRWDQTNIESTSAGSSDKLTQAEFMYYDTKSLLVQILRFLPQLAKPGLLLPKLIQMASISRDAVLVPKGLKAGDMLEQLVKLKAVTPTDSYRVLTSEVLSEFEYLGNLAESITKEMKSLDAVYKTIQEHNNYLCSQLETYKAYLQNVRVQAGPVKKNTVKKKIEPPIKYTYQKLEQEGIICQTNIPENRY